MAVQSQSVIEGGVLPDPGAPFDLLADLAARLLPSVSRSCGLHAPDASCLVCLDAAEQVAICSLASIA